MAVTENIVVAISFSEQCFPKRKIKLPVNVGTLKTFTALIHERQLGIIWEQLKFLKYEIRKCILSQNSFNLQTYGY